MINVHLATPRPAIDEVLDRQPAGTARRILESRTLESSLASLATSDDRALILGDFNMTQQSPLYRQYWQRWLNTFGSAGCGLGSTKLTRSLATRIDHILVGEHWRVLSSQVHKSLGGDHRPITAELALKVES